MRVHPHRCLLSVLAIAHFLAVLAGGGLADRGVAGDLPASEAATPVRGPRLSDEALLASLDPSFPGAGEVVRLRDASRPADALAALVALIRTREEPGDFGQRGPRRPDADVGAAEDALRHRFVVVGIPHTFGSDIDWGFNPTTAPGSQHDRDHEWTWQLNRHGFWAALARAYRDTGEEKYAREFAAQFADWVAECPVPEGRADQGPGSPWRTIEAGIRMFSSWPRAFVVFRKSRSLSDRVLLDLTKSIVEHARYLRAHPTSGNWLTMEMNGLYHAGVLLPFVEESAGWRAFAAERLLEELDRQVYPDGAQIELTPGYHNVSLGSFLGPVDVSREYSLSLPSGYVAKLERMFAYNLWAMRPDRDLPRWNDSWSVDVPRWLGRGLELFPHREDFRWVVTDGREGTAPDHASHFFPWAGQVVFRSGWDRQAVFLGFEVGPFGYGHQHEDKLGLVLFAFGKELLVEGGSYAYDASKWRAYVLSSRAHNVVLVDEREQARRGRPRRSYLSEAPIDCGFRSGGGVRSGGAEEYARGEYEDTFAGQGRGGGAGSTALARHEREVLFLKAETLFIVRDTLTPLDEQPHEYAALWHLDVEAAPLEADGVSVEGRSGDGPALRLIPSRDGDLKARIARGEEDPVVQGWLPRGHGIRGVRPIPTVIHTRRGNGSLRWVTVLEPVRSGEEGRVRAVEVTDAGATLRLEDGRTIAAELPRS